MLLERISQALDYLELGKVLNVLLDPLTDV